LNYLILADSGRTKSVRPVFAAALSVV